MSDQSTEFANPVPAARWDGPRHQRFRWAAALIGAISLLAVARIVWTVFEVAHGVNTVTELVGRTHNNSLKTKTFREQPADGASDLPGGYASVSYTPLPKQFEFFKRTDDAGAFGGSRWGLTTASDGRPAQLDLSHWLLAPMADPVAEENKKLRADYPSKTITGPRDVEIDGHKGATWKATEPNGKVNYTTWFFGPVHSFRLECGHMAGTDELARWCKAILRSTRFER